MAGLAGTGGAPRAVPPGAPGGTAPGAPRQGWINSFGATFFRAWFFAFAYDQGLNSHIGNGYLGQYTIFVPMNRRFEFQLDYQFAVSNKGGKSGSYHTNTGDTTIWGRFQLSESKNFGQIFQLGIRTPTGREETGGGVTTATMWYQFWWKEMSGNNLKVCGIINLPSLGSLSGGKLLCPEQYIEGFASVPVRIVKNRPRVPLLNSIEPSIGWSHPLTKKGDACSLPTWQANLVEEPSNTRAAASRCEFRVDWGPVSEYALMLLYSPTSRLMLLYSPTSRWFSRFLSYGVAHGQSRIGFFSATLPGPSGPASGADPKTSVDQHRLHGRLWRSFRCQFVRCNS